ncbi:hypothetical protein GRJ2_001105400 [Grus japonensis]|uniref:Uncharacterized protein n=1 Tax=Grus japonensis TaxID=30415 RepID=A0ABC9WLP8_GRUJA
MCERNNSADTNVSEEGGAGGAPGTGAEIPLQPMEKTMVRQAVPLQPMEVNDGADIHLQPVEDPTPEPVDAPEGGCGPMGSPCWSRLLAGPVDLWREEPTLEQGKRARSHPPEEEGAAETTCDELTTTPIPHPPVPLWGRR